MPPDEKPSNKAIREARAHPLVAGTIRAFRSLPLGYREEKHVMLLNKAVQVALSEHGRAWATARKAAGRD